jgi:glucose-6-phosphate isomerase
MSLDINLEYFFDGSMGYNLKSTEEYKKNIELCSNASEKVSKEIKEQSNEIFNSFTFGYQNSTKLIRDKIIKKKYQLVVGMGGSSAGAKAINMRIEGNVFFLDNYDPTYLQNLFKDYNIKDFTIYVISKSGSTFETLAMCNLIFQHLLTISTIEEIIKHVIIITEESKSLLSDFAKKNNLQVIHHNKKIGGRFSVFSETAMILFDFDSDTISNSAQSIVLKLTGNNLEDDTNPVVNAAVILTLQERYGINYNINLLYDYTLKNYSYWFHQLFAESLGKNEKALTPMTSICPKDHHSLMQLFIDGSKNKLFNIYQPLLMEDSLKFSPLGLGRVETVTPNKLLESQYLSVIKTFKNLKIPHRLVTSTGDKISNIFELFSYNILETVVLGYAQNLNPYDQPAVEQIKINTFSS